MFCELCHFDIDFITNGCKKCSEPLTQTNIKNQFNLCDKCIIGRNNWFIDETKSLLLYSKSGRNLVIKLKTNDSLFIRDKLTKFAVNQDQNFFKNIDLIIPIDLHWTKKLIRGFNQSQIIALSLSKITNIPIYSNVIFKKKNTQSQHKKLYMDRLFNIKDSFFIKNCDTIKNKNILLIDDVITTGATSNECAKLLKLNFANSIKLFTIARTLLPKNTYDY
jgi:ComF family protein